MELILRSEIFHHSPEFYSKLRKNLKNCTGCIVSKCTTETLDDCSSTCMKPCIDLKQNYEKNRISLLNDLKEEILSKCISDPDRQQCAETIKTSYILKLNSLFTNI